MTLFKWIVQHNLESMESKLKVSNRWIVTLKIQTGQGPTASGLPQSPDPVPVWDDSLQPFP